MTRQDVLGLEFGGTALRVSVEQDPRQASWFATRIAVSAHPWQGSLDATFTGDDLRHWASALRDAAIPRTVVLGGDRAAALTLQIDEQHGGTPGSLAIQVEVVPSGDDPYPLLRFLLFEIPPDFGVHAAAAVDSVLPAR